MKSLVSPAYTEVGQLYYNQVCYSVIDDITSTSHKHSSPTLEISLKHYCTLLGPTIAIFCATQFGNTFLKIQFYKMMDPRSLVRTLFGLSERWVLPQVISNLLLRRVPPCHSHLRDRTVSHDKTWHHKAKFSQISNYINPSYLLINPREHSFLPFYRETSLDSNFIQSLYPPCDISY